MARLGALLAVSVATVALVLSGVAGSASTTDAGWQSYSSQRHSFSLGLAPGWRRARARLVPKLLSPREILSVGTFPMPVGGGGNCGREPVAAIEHMGGGDALVSIQEYAVSTAMRSRMGGSGAPPALHESVAELSLRKEPHRRGERIPAGKALWSSTLPFRDHGRWFDALVYVRGDPTPNRLRQIRAILDGLRFRAGTFVRFPE